jgi:hypothetical protein
VGEPGATGQGATTRLEQVAELVVGVEGCLMSMGPGQRDVLVNRFWVVQVIDCPLVPGDMIGR